MGVEKQRRGGFAAWKMKDGSHSNCVMRSVSDWLVCRRKIIAEG